MDIDIVKPLSKLYNDWGDRQKLSPLGSADEELMGNTNLNDYQIDWLKKFISIWDKAQELERDILNLRKKVNNENIK